MSASRRQASRTVASCAAVLLFVFGGFPTSAAGETEYALLPALKTDLALEGLLLDIAHDGERLVVVGEAGHILFSDDKGLSWVHADVPVSLTITAVAFAGQDQVWATAHHGYLLHSTDNGTSWQVKLTGSDVARLSVGAIEQRVSELQVTVDNAPPDAREELEWVLDDAMFALDEATAAIDDGMTTPFLNVWFANDRDGYALGAYGIFLRTRDGGETWAVEGNRLENPDNYHLYDVARTSSGTVIVVGEAGTLLRSPDDGNEWERVDAAYTGSYFGAVAANDDSLLIYGLRGNVFRSVDQGATWTRVETGDRRTLTCGAAGEDGSVILAGAAGAVLQSHDAGSSFSVVPTEGNRVYGGVTVAPDGRVLLVGFGGISIVSGNKHE
ncbi:MAG: photosystem I reaction center subunit IV [Chromatiales bacterium]|nr:MAG: photosystem I reaction center subunit IV [Chromatiales bacterium]